MHVYSTDLFLKLTFANYVYFKVSHCKNLSNSSDIYHWESSTVEVIYFITLHTAMTLEYLLLFFVCSIFCLFWKFCLTFLLIYLSERKNKHYGCIYLIRFIKVVSFWSLKIKCWLLTEKYEMSTSVISTIQNSPF